MSRYLKLGVGVFLIVAAVALLSFFVSTNDIAVLNPKGMIGEKQRNLMIIAVALSMLVIIPVFAMTFAIAWKYRVGNASAEYSPEWDHNHIVETVWWGIPIAIILVLGVITWKSSHDLDPFRALDSDVKPLRVQVIALQWKWLFLYPDEHVASVNSLYVPVGRPVNFELTSDAPMNSFWIPKLGSQVYAMAGMSTQLHLIANETGEYPGSSANISGEGFADMAFMTHAVSPADFKGWVLDTRDAAELMSDEIYSALSVPNRDPVRVGVYRLDETGLYDRVVMKYMMPPEEMDHTAASYEMNHEH